MMAPQTASTTMFWWLELIAIPAKWQVPSIGKKKTAKEVKDQVFCESLSFQSTQAHKVLCG